MTDVNPYAAPQSRVDDLDHDSADESLRRAHLNHEANVKSAGTLNVLVALALLGMLMTP